jgi:hypothetical protein
MSSEEVYDSLMENAQKINLSDLIDKLLDEHLDGNGDGDAAERIARQRVLDSRDAAVELLRAQNAA